MCEIYAWQLFRTHVFDLTSQHVLIFYVLVIDRRDCTSTQSASEMYFERLGNAKLGDEPRNVKAGADTAMWKGYRQWRQT